MKNQQLYDALLVELYSVLKKPNSAPSFSTEDELYYYVNAYNILVRRLQLKEINWSRDNNSLVYTPIKVLYIPFGKIKN